MMGIRNDAVSFAMGLLACVAVILMVADYEAKFGKCMDFLAKYTMPIFLMHTLTLSKIYNFAYWWPAVAGHSRSADALPGKSNS